MYCPAHKSKSSSSKTGHFDLVYCCVLKLLPRNSWHHWLRISTITAVGGTYCFSALHLKSPLVEQVPLTEEWASEHTAFHKCSGHQETKIRAITRYLRVDSMTLSEHPLLSPLSLCLLRDPGFLLLVDYNSTRAWVSPEWTVTKLEHHPFAPQRYLPQTFLRVD